MKSLDKVTSEPLQRIDTSQTQLALRALVTRSILAKLEKTEYTREAVNEHRSVIKSASISLSKGVLSDEILDITQKLLVSDLELHKTCRADYRSLLRVARDKGVYSNWNEETLKILDGKSVKYSTAKNLVSLPPLSYTTKMEMHLLAVNDKPLKIETSEIESLLAETRKQNESNPVILDLAANDGLLRECYDKTQRASQVDSVVFRQGKPISKWYAKEISSWANSIKKELEIARDSRMLPELLAVTARAVYLNTGNLPRAAQMLSLIMINIESDKGKLMQISTGEGKSTTTAMAATVQVLKGKKVDVVTSSSVLASRDASEWKSFYNIFNISNAHNITDNYIRGAKDCYSKDIVYGDTLHFQSDILRDEYKLLGTRGGRNFKDSVVLIDEVDSMLIDESGKIAKLATPIPSMEYLAPIFVASFHYLNQTISYFKDEEVKGESDLKSLIPWIQENLTEYIKKLVGTNGYSDNVEQITAPRHLQRFVEQQATIWAKSAVQALTMSEKRDYLIIEVSGKKVVAPVDYVNTGVVQEKTSWMNGLHQFLQIKHNLAMSSENLTTSFISNTAYFKRYGNQIFGMSGTLGSKDEQELLRRVYDVDLAFIPTFKIKRFKEIPGIVADSTKSWHENIADSVKAQTSSGRAVLVLAETIDDVEKIEEVLIKSGVDKKRINTYTTGSTEETKHVLENKAMSGDIIIATNIAGRGTDIKTSKAVEGAGGLHVCLTFLPSNLRVEDQAMGRTARQGNPGTGQLVINGAYESLKLFDGLMQESDVIDTNLSDIDIIKQRRNAVETLRIQDIEERLLPKIKLEDEMFTQFSRLTHKMRSSEDNIYKLRQLEEHWGLWFKETSNLLELQDISSKIPHDEILENFKVFKRDMETRYFDGNSIMQNHVYLTQEGVSKLGEHNSYDASVELLKKATTLAGEYGFAAHYNLAYAYFRQNGENIKKNDMRLVENGINHLNEALMQLDGVIIPQLHMMQIFIGEESNNSDLSMQIATKLNLHKLQSEYIRNAIVKTQDGLERGKIIVVNNRDTKPVFALLGQSPSNPSEEVLELNRYGVAQLFTLDAKNPPKDIMSAIGMTIIGISQFVVGALVTVCTGGAATSMGVSMMLSGAQDLYKGVRVGMGKDIINWSDYWVNKGISYAVSFVSMGWDNFKAGLNAIKEQVGRIAEAGKNFLTNTASTVMGKQAASQIVTSTVQKGANTTFTGIMSEFIAKEGMSKVVMEVGRSIALQNLTNVVAKEIANSLDETKEDIRENSYKQIMNTLTSEPNATRLNRLITIDRMMGNHRYVSEIKKAANELLAPKIDRITQLAKQLSTAAMTGMASRSNNITTQIGVKVISTGFQMAEAAKEIKNLLADFCDDLTVRIAAIEHSSSTIMTEIMYTRMKQRSLADSDVNSIIEILKMNQVLRPDTMQFETQLLEPILGFVSGITFTEPLPKPKVANPIMFANTLINKPSVEEIKAFQLQDLKQKNTNEPQNIEKVDFGPYRDYREAIIRASREINEFQTADYSQEKTQLAEELSSKVTDRTMGIVRHSIITPVVSPVINFSTEVLTTHFVNLTTKNITGVSSGDSNFLPQEHEEVLPLEINPQLNGEETDYVLKVHYRAIGFSKDDETGEIKQSTSPGHIYYELIDVNASKKGPFFSAYPKNEDDSLIGKLYNPMHDKSHPLDEFQHEQVMNHMSKTGQQALFTKVLFLTPDQFKTTSEFAKTINQNRTYVLGKNDCSDLGKELFEKIDIPTEYNFLFNKTELSQAFVGTKIKIMHGNRDSMFTVKGTSREEIAAKYKVPVERVVKKYPELNTSITTLNSTKDNFIRDMEYDILPFKK